MSTFKTKQTHSVSKHVIKWPPATVIDELHLFANKSPPYHCHVNNQVNVWVNKSAQREALAALFIGCKGRPSRASEEGKAPQWQRSTLLLVLPCFQRATVRTKLNLETKLYRSQFALIQILAWHKGKTHTDTHSVGIHGHPIRVVPDDLGQAVSNSNSKVGCPQAQL